MHEFEQISNMQLPKTSDAAHRVFSYASVDSTNSVARTLVERGLISTSLMALPNIDVVVTDRQTQGRGRLGRTWVSEEDESFTVSFVAKIPMRIVTDNAVNGWLPILAGLSTLQAVHDVTGIAIGERSEESQYISDGLALPNPSKDSAAADTPGSSQHSETHGGLMLKWPNDLFIDGCKLGGILVQFVEFPKADSVVAVGSVGRSNQNVAGNTEKSIEKNAENNTGTVVEKSTAGIQGRARNSGGEETEEKQAAVIFGIGLNLFLPEQRFLNNQSTSIHAHWPAYRNSNELTDQQGGRGKQEGQHKQVGENKQVGRDEHAEQTKSSLPNTPIPQWRILRDELAAAIVTQLGRSLSAFIANPGTYSVQLHAEVTPLCWILGRRVEAKPIGVRSIVGKALALEEDASLLILDEQGITHRIHTADVGILQ